MRTLLYQWIKINFVILLNAASLVTSFVVTSGLGFAYWWVAARQFPPEAIGFASAAISATSLLGIICMLGLGTLLIRELPRQEGKEVSLISAALTLVACVGGCVGLLFAVVAPTMSVDLQPLRASIQNVALFTAGVSLAAVSLVLDEALIGLLRSDLKLWRNTLFSGAKLVALFVAGFWLFRRAGVTMYATWVLGSVLSLAALAGFAMWKGNWTGRISLPHMGLIRKLSASALQHHLLNLLFEAPGMALPVLVTVLISATMNGWFYISFLLAGMVYIVSYALTTALYADSSAQPSALAHKARLTLGLAVIICVFANCVLLFGAKQLLGLFGPSYAQQGAWSLRILGLGVFPFIIKEHYIAIYRVQDRIRNALLPVTIGALLEVGAAALGGRLGGISGLSLGWITAVCVEAMFMAPMMYKAIRPTRTSANKDQLQPYTP
ncbi:MAG: hypothetical protein NVSMB27_14230 [Ktedonobacteraceae bacterium]